VEKKKRGSAWLIKEQRCLKRPSHALSAGALLCHAVSCLHLSRLELAALIAQEGATATLHHEGSEKDSFQIVFSTLLYFLKHSAEPRLTPHVCS